MGVKASILVPALLSTLLICFLILATCLYWSNPGLFVRIGRRPAAEDIESEGEKEPEVVVIADPPPAPRPGWFGGGGGGGAVNVVDATPGPEDDVQVVEPTPEGDVTIVDARPPRRFFF